MAKRKSGHIERSLNKAVAALVAVAALLFLAGCGGGGGGRSAASTSGDGIMMSPPPWPTPTLAQTVRTTAVFDHATYYMPTLGQWFLFNATAGQNWISAIGSQAGLSASMANPFNRVGVLLLPRFNNPGTVAFFIDGKPAGTFDLAAKMNSPGFTGAAVYYYEIARDLDDTVTHTVSMVIASGTVGFDGWRMRYHEQIYEIDCADANTLESDTLSSVESLRDIIEDYAERNNGDYPDPASGTSLIDYLGATPPVFITIPTNPFTGKKVKDSGGAFSAGDFHYERLKASDSEYILTAYGGAAPLVTYTHTSAQSLFLYLTLSAPPKDHYTTGTADLTFAGTSNLLIPNLNLISPIVRITGAKVGAYHSPADPAFSDTITLNPGKNLVKVIYSLGADKSVSLLRTITLDQNAPLINVISPFPMLGPPEALYAYSDTNGAATLTVYVEPGTTATVNGTPAPVDAQGYFSLPEKIPSGTDTIAIDIKAVDQYGNKNQKDFNLMLRK